jgi:hypothetical protein
MVGTYRRWGLACLSCALLAASIAGSAWGEVVKGQSRDLGIQFVVRGGAAWCAPDVVVELTAEKTDAFKPDTLPFVRMLGRIRAVVIDQCASVEQIGFDATTKGRSVLFIEMTRLTKWRRLIKIDPGTRRPSCPTQELAGTDCGKRVDAYLFMHKIMHRNRFAGAELTTVLDAQDTAHAVWVLADIIGKLTIRDRNEFSGRFRSNTQLAEAMLDGFIGQCHRDGALPVGIWSETLSDGSDLAVRGFSCRPPNDIATNHAFMVMSKATRFYVFALLHRGNDPEAVKRAAQELARAIADVR